MNFLKNLKENLQYNYHCSRPGCEESFMYDEALKSSEEDHEVLWCPECRRMVGVIRLKEDD